MSYEKNQTLRRLHKVDSNGVELSYSANRTDTINWVFALNILELINIICYDIEWTLPPTQIYVIVETGKA